MEKFMADETQNTSATPTPPSIDEMVSQTPTDQTPKPEEEKPEADDTKPEEPTQKGATPAGSASSDHARLKRIAADEANGRDGQRRPPSAGQIMALGFLEMVGGTPGAQERRALRAQKKEAGQKERTRIKQTDNAVRAYNAAAKAEQSLKRQINLHHNRYGAIDAEIKSWMKTPDIQALPQEDRATEAMRKALVNHPEFTQKANLKQYGNDRKDLFKRAQEYQTGVKGLSDHRAAIMQADSDLQNVSSELLQRASAEDNLLAQASRAPTPDGQEDEDLKKKLKKMWDEMMESISKLLDELMDKVLGRDSSGPAGP
jgi:hypothetical protein